MGTTIIGPESSEIPFPVAPPRIEIKHDWSDEWRIEPELELVRCVAAASGEDLGVCELRRRYGAVKGPQDDDFYIRKSWKLLGYWVRISVLGTEGYQTIWVGQISTESREIHGTDSSESGIQTWVAYEPLQILRKTRIAESYWLESGQEKTIAWIPPMNSRDAQGTLIGNRSAAKSNGTYLYGGSDIWTRYDALEYIVKRFLDRSSAGGPTWTIGGQADLLKDLTDMINFGSTQTVAEALRRLIPVRLGMDYTIVPTEDGFEISIYALTSDEWSFGGATLPRNPNTVRIRSGQHPDLVRAEVVRTIDHQYDRIRVLGRRIVMCCTLRADDGSLVPKWTSSLETAYKDGTGSDTDSAAKQDKVRQQDRFRPVYQLFGAPANWDHQGGAAAPVIDAEGNINWGSVSNYQNQVRETLSWIPLREGLDYSTDPPTDQNPSGYTPDLLPPAAWLYDPEGSGRYVLAEEVGVSVSALRSDLGVFLQAQPNHLLAKGHWTGARKTTTQPKYDYDKLVVTLAFETDQRQMFSYELPGGGDGSTMDIEVPDAELWLLAPNTVVGVASDGTLKTSGSNGRVLRDDGQRMMMVMAGALARYYVQRARARIVLKGLWPMSELIGQILTVVEEGNDSTTIHAPITSVEWIIGDSQQTVIKTGFAQ